MLRVRVPLVAVLADTFERAVGETTSKLDCCVVLLFVAVFVPRGSEALLTISASIWLRVFLAMHPRLASADISPLIDVHLLEITAPSEAFATQIAYLHLSGDENGCPLQGKLGL
jgi:hypothetical protein